jgi:hypothetical protein
MAQRLTRATVPLLPYLLMQKFLDEVILRCNGTEKSLKSVYW